MDSTTARRVNRLRERRRHHGISLRALAARLDLSPAAILRREQCKRKTIRAHQLDAWERELLALIAEKEKRNED